MIDATKGSLSRALLKLAIPFIMAMLLETVMQLTDMFFVSRLGSASIAAVSFCGIILLLLSTIVEGISASALAIVARRVGEADKEGANIAASNTMFICLLLSIITGIGGYYIAGPTLKILGAPEDVYNLGIGYIQYSFLGIYSMFFLFIVQAIMRGAGEPIYPMLILSGSAFMNIIFDPLFIFGLGPFPKLGVTGAAIATVTARTIASTIGIYLLFSGKTFIKLTLKKMKIDLNIIATIFRIAFPAMGRMSLNSITRVILMKIVALFGTSAIAAYGIGLRLDMVAFLPGLGFAAATSTIVGQNLGAKKIDRAERSTIIALLCNIAVVGTIAVLFLLFSENIISVFDKSAEVMRIGTMYIYIVVPSYFFMAGRLVYNGSLRGAGDTYSTMVASFISMVLMQIPLAYLLAKYTSLDVYGVFISVAAVNFFETLMLYYWFKKGKWKYKKV
ncbi:MAG: MATE family efflux transporter [Candidatus Schekmanbacteria bacterium]|nr:MAG: MATE family efflux transporter [Candidatus Schekmanbacteria bacterium]